MPIMVAGRSSWSPQVPLTAYPFLSARLDRPPSLALDGAGLPILAFEVRGDSAVYVIRCWSRLCSPYRR
jgi:hypothetical protein